MMRSPQLSYFLDSPHLWYDATAANLTVKDLEAAEKYIKGAKEGKDAIDQLNNAYQSMYCSTMALLHSIRYKVSNFRAIITVLEDYFVKNGMLEKIHVDNLIRAQQLVGPPAENIEMAESYLAAVKKVLGK